MKLSKSFLIFGFLLSGVASAATTAEVCDALHAIRGSFAAQVNCLVVSQSAATFDPVPADLCLQIARQDQPAYGANVVQCLQAIANKSLGASNLKPCEILIERGNNAAAVSCLADLTN